MGTNEGYHEPRYEDIISNIERRMKEPGVAFGLLAIGLRGLDTDKAFELRDRMCEKAIELEKQAEMLSTKIRERGPTSMMVVGKDEKTPAELLDMSKEVVTSLLYSIEGLTSLKANMLREKLTTLSKEEEKLESLLAA